MKILKTLTAIFLALAISLTAFGCTSKSNTSSKTDAADTITITDHMGDKVTLPKNINRIVVADIYPLPSVLSVFFDSAKKIVGMAGPSMIAAKNSLLSELYPEILNASTGFIDGTTVNTEEVLKLNPDVVFYSTNTPAVGEQLKKAGIPCVALSVSKWEYNTIETLNQWISLLGQIFPDNDKTEFVKQKSDEIYNLVQERVSTLSDKEKLDAFFLFQYSDSSIVTAGKNSFGTWWSKAMGVNNVAKELAGNTSSPVTMEQIYKWNPKIIFVTNFNSATTEDIYKSKIGNYDWSQLDAVKNNRVYKMPLGMYRSYTPGVDTPITLLWLAGAAYPDLFKDVDITEKAREYYKSVFGIELTDKQVDRIFAPAAEAGSGFLN